MSVFKRRKPDDAEPLTETRSGRLPASLDPQQSGGGYPADSGLGVPPFRPALPPSGAQPAFKETAVMGRSPFAAPPPSPAPLAAGGQQLSTLGAGARSTGSGVAIARAREPAERRTLVVGRGISLQGVVQDAERLVVEGTVEATMIHATELSVSQGGVFKGEVEVEDAEVAGTIDGTLTARGNLVVRATGRVMGTARCRRLQVEDGGQITGRMEMLTEAPPAPIRVAEPLRSEAAD